jgi:hypothetical protein
MSSADLFFIKNRKLYSQLSKSIKTIRNILINFIEPLSVFGKCTVQVVVPQRPLDQKNPVDSRRLIH